MHINLKARPEAITIDTARTALVINDMQNAFCSRGGYIDRIGFDLGGVPNVVAQVQRVLTAARAAGLTVIHLQNGFSPDLREAPGSRAPIWHKSNALRYMRAHPAENGRVLVRGSWDCNFIDELRPNLDELVIQKHSDNGFSGTNLDHLMRSRDLTTMLVCGISSNVGVESTIRAGYHAGYFGVMIADACMAVGPPFMQAATEFNIETFYGWLSVANHVLEGLAGASDDKLEAAGDN
jgi:ureidoacrylate peracid hydrolase